MSINDIYGIRGGASLQDPYKNFKCARRETKSKIGNLVYDVGCKVGCHWVQDVVTKCVQLSLDSNILMYGSYCHKKKVLITIRKDQGFNYHYKNKST